MSGAVDAAWEQWEEPLDEEPDTASDCEEAIHTYKHWLLGLASGEASYTGSMDDVTDRRITVYGVGTPSATLREAMNQAPDDLHVRWASVPYSRTELLEAVERVWRAVPEVVSSRTGADLATLDVQVDHARVKEEDLQRVTEAIQEAAGVPVTVQRGGVVLL